MGGEHKAGELNMSIRNDSKRQKKQMQQEPCFVHRLKIVTPCLLRCLECGHEEPFDATEYNCVTAALPEGKNQVAVGGRKLSRGRYVKELIAYLQKGGDFGTWLYKARYEISKERPVVAHTATPAQSKMLHGILIGGKKRKKAHE